MTPSQCSSCKYYIFDRKCEAYPEMIPEEIITGLFTHDKKYKDQKNDILYEEIDDIKNTV